MSVAVRGFVLLATLVLGGCDSFPDRFECASDGQCVHQGQNGVCMSQACAFPDTGCGSGFRFDRSAPPSIEGTCVGDAPPVDGGRPRDSGGMNACGGLLPLDGDPGDPCGRCMMGAYECDGLNSVRCMGQPTSELDITGSGTVAASTTFSAAFEARLAVDGDLQTSWFSAGSSAEGGGQSTYEWVLDADACIASVSIDGNDRQLNPMYRTNYGFNSVMVEIVDEVGAVTWSDTYALTGTPDPRVAATPNTVGRKIRLVFSGHEDPDCGGFAELTVTAASR